MRGIAVLAGLAAAAFMAQTAQGASSTTLVSECQHLAPPGHVCVLGRVTGEHTIQALVTTRDLPNEGINVWASDASENYRPIPELDRFAGRLVLLSADWSGGALFHGRVLMVPTYARHERHR